MHQPLVFKTLTQAIEEAHRWGRECDLPSVVTIEEDGSYTLYGHGERVYNHAPRDSTGGELEVYRLNGKD